MVSSFKAIKKTVQQTKKVGVNVVNSCLGPVSIETNKLEAQILFLNLNIF